MDDHDWEQALGEDPGVGLAHLHPNDGDHTVTALDGNFRKVEETLRKLKPHLFTKGRGALLVSAAGAIGVIAGSAVAVNLYLKHRKGEKDE